MLRKSSGGRRTSPVTPFGEFFFQWRNSEWRTRAIFSACLMTDPSPESRLMCAVVTSDPSSTHKRLISSPNQIRGPGLLLISQDMKAASRSIVTLVLVTNSSQMSCALDGHDPGPTREVLGGGSILTFGRGVATVGKQSSTRPVELAILTTALVLGRFTSMWSIDPLTRWCLCRRASPRH